MDAMVDKVPGFGGVYYDRDGIAVVQIKRGNRHDPSSPALKALLRDHPRRLGAAPAGMRFVDVSYTFRELHRWHDAALPEVAAISGWAYSDVDEANNVVAIGVSSASAKAEVVRRLASLNIPLNALEVRIVKPFHGQPLRVRPQVDPIQPDSSPDYSQGSGPTTIGDAIRPVLAGTVIGTQVGYCTIGFNTQKVRRSDLYGAWVYDQTHYFVTAGHCMPTPGYASGSWIAQGGAYFDSEFIIGQERRQPTWRTWDECPAGVLCSLSDAALVAYVYADGAMARIARPKGGSNSGSFELDPFLPTFVVQDSTEKEGWMIAGTLVSKVGVGSGWTSGYVSGTCLNTPADWPGYVLLCQDTHNAANAEGDSGAPVFQISLDGTRARMVGLHWGGNGTTGVYSTYVNTRYELTRVDIPTYCTGNCWLGLNVSGAWQ